jgi:hypothetical protein
MCASPDLLRGRSGEERFELFGAALQPPADSQMPDPGRGGHFPVTLVLTFFVGLALALVAAFFAFGIILPPSMSELLVDVSFAAPQVTSLYGPRVASSRLVFL